MINSCKDRTCFSFCMSSGKASCPMPCPSSTSEDTVIAATSSPDLFAEQTLKLLDAGRVHNCGLCTATLHDGVGLITCIRTLDGQEATRSSLWRVRFLWMFISRTQITSQHLSLSHANLSCVQRDCERCIFCRFGGCSSTTIKHKITAHPEMRWTLRADDPPSEIQFRTTLLTLHYSIFCQLTFTLSDLVEGQRDTRRMKKKLLLPSRTFFSRSKLLGTTARLKGPLPESKCFLLRSPAPLKRRGTHLLHTLLTACPTF